MKPFLKNPGYKTTPVISVFEGINTAVEPLLLPDGAAADMKNIDSRAYPAICPRQPREEVDLSSFNMTGKKIRYIGKILLKNDNQSASDLEAEQNFEYLSFVAGNEWWYLKDSEWKPIIQSGDYFADSMDGVFFVDSNILVSGKTSNRAALFNISGKFSDVQEDRGFPVSNFIISHANRLYAASKHASYLYGSGLRKHTIWQSATNSIAFEFDTPDDETCSGIASYAERLLFFKPHCMYEIYGTDPLTGYSTAKLSGSIGCMSHRSIKEVGGALYFLGDKAVYEYRGGSLPQNIGLPVKKYLDNAVNMQKSAAASFKNRYYLSLEQEGGNGVILIYDTESKMWYKEDDIKVKCFAVVGGELYASFEDNGVDRIIKMEGDSGEKVLWYWHSKYFSSETLHGPQNYKRLYLRFEKDDDAHFDVYVLNDRGEKKKVTGQVCGNIMRIELPTYICHRAMWIQLEIRGEGNCRICALESQRRTRGGSY